MLLPIFSLSAPRPMELVLSNVPPHVIYKLRERAVANQRTVQDELYAIIERALVEDQD